MRIRVLDDRLIDQIAAGEVVERPASVVKELVENALDAEATEVRVSLRGGGRTLVRVADNGVGMDRDDALLCLERHATSKIRSAEDLAGVLTLGFRGEALPSIASVSRFTLTTRPADADVGTRVAVEGGTIADVSDAGCAAGTAIDVRSLFYNLPVRRRFLRTQATELGHCVEQVVRQAMARPDVAFELRHDERDVLRVAATADPARRVGDLLGDHGKALVPVRFAAQGLDVHGWVSPVGVHRSTRTGSQYLYVNGRYVRDAVLQRAITEAYRGIVPKGRYPVVVLHVAIDPREVDVNVHPSKVEVRFRQPRDVTRVLASGIREGLEDHGIRRPVQATPDPPTTPWVPADGPTLPLPAPPSRVPPPPPGPPPGLPAHPGDDPRFVGSPRPRVPEAPPPPAPAVAAEPPTPPLRPERDDALLPTRRYRDLRVIGQLADSYVLCEGGGDLIVVDQHAAHERVMLHRLLSDRRAHIGAAQRLLTPRVVELPRAHAEALVDRLDVLASVNLEVERVGDTRFAVTGVPATLENLDVDELVRSVAEQVAVEGASTAAEDVGERILATMACHAAVRAHDPLTPYQMQALLAALDEVDVSVCAHGRPVAIRIGTAELERRFHRT